MSKREVSFTKAFVLFIFFLLVGIVVTVYTQAKTIPSAKAASQALPSLDVPTPPQPQAPVAPKTSVSEVDSAKGDQKLFLRGSTDSTGTTRYIMSVTNMDGSNARTIFTKDEAAGTTLSLPFNAWDPTDTYIFLKEQRSSGFDFFVLKSNGEPLNANTPYIDVGAVWTAKKIQYAIRDATGWASGTLLIIYTSAADGTHGPAFWFEIPDTAIIQLAR